MSLGSELAPHLPTLRRYARLTCGDLETGDLFVRQALEQIVASPDDFPRDVDPKLGLFATFNDVSRRTTRGHLSGPRSDEEAWEDPKVSRLSKLPMVSRQALLLTTVEDFSEAEAAYILGISEPDVRGLVSEALRAFMGKSKARVLLIGPQSEMRAVSKLVSDMGHQVLGPFQGRAAAQIRQDLRPALVIANAETEVTSLDIVRSFKRPTIILSSNACLIA